MADKDSNKEEEEKEDLTTEESEDIAEEVEADSSEEEKTEEIEEESQTENFTGSAKNWKPVGREAPIMTDADYMKDRVDGQISYFNAKSSQNQKKYKKIKRWEIVIASLIPVIISLSAMGIFQSLKFEIPLGETIVDGEVVKVNGKVLQKTVSFGVDTILLIIAAFGGVIQVIFNKLIDLEEHYKLWKDYRSNCEALENQRLLYLTRTEPYDEEDAFPIFVDKIESILINEQQKWKQRQAPQQQKQAGAKNQANPLDQLKKAQK